LNLEALESRTLLSGNVTANLDLAGVLHISGDIGNNALSVISSPDPLEPTHIRVQGDPGSLTTVNGVTFAEFEINSVVSIQVNYLNGRDSIKFTGPWPLLANGVPPLPGNIIVNTGTGVNTLSISGVNANSVTFNGAGTASSTVSVTGAKVSSLNVLTGNGADSVTLTSDTIGTANINTGNGGDAVTIGGAGSKIGSLSLTAGTGVNNLAVTGTTISQATITAGDQTGSVNVSGNTFLTNATVNVATGHTLSAPAAVNVDGNTFTTGNLAVNVGSGPSGPAGNLLTVSVSNDTFVKGGAAVGIGDNALSVTADGDTVAGNLGVTVGNGAGNVAVSGDNAGSIQAQVGDNAGNVAVNGNTTGANLGVVAGANAANLTVNGDTVGGNLGVTAGSGAGNVALSNDTAASQTVTILGGSASVSETSVTTTGGATVQVGVGGDAGSVSLTTVSASTLALAVGDGATVALSGVATTSGVLSVTVGNNATDISLTNVTAATDLDLSAGTGTPSLELSNVGTGNNLVVNITQADVDLTTTTLTNVNVGNDFTMNSGLGSQGGNILLLSSLTVGDDMEIRLSNGVNAVQAQNVTTFFGDINLGSGAADTYFNLGGNFAYAVTYSEYIDPSNLSLSAGTINEGSSVTLTGSFRHIGDSHPHTITINWGDGSANTVLNLAPDVFNFSAPHRYLDNLPGNAPYAINVTVTDSAGNKVSAGTSIVVNNVAPVIPSGALKFSSPTLSEGGTATLNGSFTDPGVLDTHTVQIHWGDGSPDTTLNLAAGVLSFSAKHQYVDNLPGNAAYPVTVTVTDKEGATTSAGTALTVNNVPPSGLSLNWVAATTNEGDTAALNGSFTDPGVLDTHTVLIHWGDGSPDTTLSLGPGVLTFSANHLYTDNLPGNAPYAASVTVTDKDGASGTGGTSLTVMNVAPAGLSLGLASATISEGDTAVLNGTFTDPGVLDNHTVVVHWGDGSPDTTLALGPGVLTFSASHPYADNLPGDAPYSIGVTVTDKDGASATGSTPLTVKNVAPVANSGPDQSVPVGQAATLNGSFTDPGTLDGHTFHWVVVASNGQVVPAGNSATFGFTPSDVGTYTVTLSVTDSDGAVGTSTTHVVATAASIGSINGTVFLDSNANGVHDAGEVGRPGVTVYLDLNGNGQFDAGESTALTDANGNYSFTGLAPGAYTVRVNPVFPNLAATGPSGGNRAVVGTGLTTSTVAGIDLGVMPFSLAYPVHFNPDEFATRPSTDVNTAFVKGLYHAVLGRDGEATGVAFWVQVLSAGISRDAVTRAFNNSPEHRQQEVDAYYRAFLGRAANDAGSQYWVNLLQAHGDEDEVIQGILTSAEYTAKHATSQAFVSDLYFSLLGRASDAAGAAYWQDLLDSGTSRAAVVDGFLHTREAATLAEESFYAAFLRRPSDSMREVWIAQLTGGTVTFGQLAVQFLAGVEFFQLAGSNLS
jgi:hypothetical protein